MGSFWRCFMPVWKNQSTSVLSIPESLCKGANVYQAQDGCLGTQDPFSELPLESVMLLHLLLREFIDSVVELCGQQGAAVGVGCVRVKRESSFVRGQQGTASVEQGIVPGVPISLLWDYLWVQTTAAFLTQELRCLHNSCVFLYSYWVFPDQCVFSVSSIN